VADDATLHEIEARGQVLLRYVDASGEPTPEANPNGSLRSIAGVMNAGHNVFGLMPHPEHAVEAIVGGGEDGRKLLGSLIDALEQPWSAARAGAT
jgi:phosphoribosylformylglycinamidine synthase